MLVVLESGDVVGDDRSGFVAPKVAPITGRETGEVFDVDGVSELVDVVVDSGVVVEADDGGDIVVGSSFAGAFRATPVAKWRPPQ